MPDIDPFSKMLGELHAMASHTVQQIDVLFEQIDTIRSDQISGRREVDYVKTMVKEQKEMIDAMAPTIKDHHTVIEKVKPLMSTLENIDTGRKVTKWGFLAIITLGGANLLIPAWHYVQDVIGRLPPPTIGPGP